MTSIGLIRKEEFLSLLHISQVNKIFGENAFDAVIHFAAVAYVGENTLDPLRFIFFSFKKIYLSNMCSCDIILTI